MEGHSELGLMEDEQEVMDHLVQAWNKYLNLSESTWMYEDGTILANRSLDQFRAAISSAQTVLGRRILARLYDGWLI